MIEVKDTWIDRGMVNMTSSYRNLKNMCNQTMTKLSCIYRDDYGDNYYDLTRIPNSVTLHGTIPVILHDNLFEEVDIKVSYGDTPTTYYQVGVDYTLDRETGLIARTSDSSIPDGQTVNIEYNNSTYIKVRIQNEDVVIVDKYGKDIVSHCQITTYDRVIIKFTDRLESEDFQSQHPVIHKIDRNRNRKSVFNHSVIYT